MWPVRLRILSKSIRKRDCLKILDELDIYNDKPVEIIKQFKRANNQCRTMANI